MTTELLEPSIFEETESQGFEGFLDKNEKTIDEARIAYTSEHWKEYAELPKKISWLYNKYRKETEDTSDVLNRILTKIVDRKYVDAEERELHAQATTDGIYVPVEETGGDFWEKKLETRGNVRAGAELVDICGHGEEAVYVKMLVHRFLKLYNAETNPPADRLHVFAALDSFLSELPYEHKMLTADYIKAEVQENDGENFLDLEIAGNATLFFRDRETGMIHKRFTPGYDDFSSASDILVPLVIHDYVVLGAEVTKDSERKINHIPMPKGTDVFMLSDGVFDLPDFQNQFETLCRFHRDNKSTPEEFSLGFNALIQEIIKKVKDEGLERDDVTVNIIHIERPGKVS